MNGRLVTVSVLGRILSTSRHSRPAPQALLKPEAHLMWLDLCTPVKAAGLARRVSGLWRRYRDTVRKLTEWETQSRERERRRDLLLFQLNEIGAAQLKIGEDEELRARHRVLANAEKLFETLATGLQQSAGRFRRGARRSISWKQRLNSFPRPFSGCRKSQLSSSWWKARPLKPVRPPTCCVRPATGCKRILPSWPGSKSALPSLTGCSASTETTWRRFWPTVTTSLVS